MKKREEGFTLLEVLLATALSALLLVTLYSTYFSIARSIDVTLGTQEVMETGRVLIEMVKRDIRGVSGTRFPFISTLDEVNGGMVTNVAFVTSAPSATNPFTWTKVGYALLQDSEGRLVFVKKAAKNPKDDLDQLGSVFEVSRMVNSFRLSFFDGAQWLEKWDSRTSGKLPLQVRIQVELVNEKKEVQLFTAEESVPGTL